MLCGDCPPCLAYTSDVLRVPPSPVTVGPLPTVAGLQKHAERFGPELVAETAAQYGLTVEVKREDWKARRDRLRRRR